MALTDPHPQTPVTYQENYYGGEYHFAAC